MNHLEILNSKVGQKVTMFKLSDFGFPQSINCVLEKVELKDYAQYKNLVTIQFRPAKKRTSYVVRIYDHSSIMFYNGHITLNSDMYVKTLSSEPGFTVRESLVGFSNGYFDIAKNSTDQKPFLEIIKD